MRTLKVVIHLNTTIMDENTRKDKIQIFIASTVILFVVVMVLLVAFGAFDRK